MATGPRSGEGRGFEPHRAARLARVIVTAHYSESDVRTVAELSRASETGFAPGTFRSWCHAEGIKTSRVVDFTRVFRAVRLASEEGCPVAECLDADERTIRDLLGRGGVVELLTSVPYGPEDFCHRQRYLTNRFVITEVLRIAALSRNA